MFQTEIVEQDETQILWPIPFSESVTVFKIIKQELLYCVTVYIYFQTCLLSIQQQFSEHTQRLLKSLIPNNNNKMKLHSARIYIATCI